MIRDPSDGSVRHQPKPLEKQSTILEKPLSVTGLREPSSKAEYMERLDRSRKWLSKYRTNPERIARLMGETGE